MKLQKIFLVFITLLVSFQICLGQDFVEDENWIGKIEGGQPEFLMHRFKNYSKEDVINAREKLSLIHKTQKKDEWEGSYSLFGELSDNKLVWNSEFGFVNYYIYTCAIELRALNYGRIESNSESVTLFYEKTQPPLAGTVKTGQRKFIKVKWGERHYLIGEEQLEDFCELAAGYYEAKNKEIEVNGEKFQNEIRIWNSFWVNNEESYKKKVFGLPILPKSYERFIKLPIETKITSIGKIENKVAEEENDSSSTTHYLTINAGKNKGIKEGMNFYVPKLRERISIEKVYKNTSIASLTRDYDKESQKEHCYIIGEEIPCIKPIVGIEAKTIPAEFLED